MFSCLQVTDSGLQALQHLTSLRDLNLDIGECMQLHVDFYDVCGANHCKDIEAAESLRPSVCKVSHNLFCVHSSGGQKLIAQIRACETIQTKINVCVCMCVCSWYTGGILYNIILYIYYIVYYTVYILYCI